MSNLRVGNTHSPQMQVLPATGNPAPPSHGAGFFPSPGRSGSFRPRSGPARAPLGPRSGSPVGFRSLPGIFALGNCLIGDQVHAVSCSKSVIILDGSNVPAADGTAVLLFGGVIVVRIMLVAGFLKMVLQLLFCVAAALTHGTHLLRRWCGVGVLVRTKIPRIPAYFLAHSGIVPLDVGLGNLWPLPQGLDVGPEP
jgi:hypothetical protein